MLTKFSRCRNDRGDTVWLTDPDPDRQTDAILNHQRNSSGRRKSGERKIRLWNVMGFIYRLTILAQKITFTNYSLYILYQKYIRYLYGVGTWIFRDKSVDILSADGLSPYFNYLCTLNLRNGIYMYFDISQYRSIARRLFQEAISRISTENLELSDTNWAFTS